MSVHRFIPASEKHGPKTACGIRLFRSPDGFVASGNYKAAFTEKGQPFDCERCRRVLELRLSNEGFNIRGNNEQLS